MFSKDIKNVALPLIGDRLQSEDYASEPQIVKIRSQNGAYLYASSIDTNNSADSPADIIVGASRAGTALSRNIKRIGVTFVEFFTNTTVINNTNDTFYVYRQPTNSVYTATMPHGDWNTPQKLYIALKTALDTVPGLTIQYIFKGTAVAPPLVAPLTDNVILLNITAGGPILFLSESSAVRHGRSTFGFQRVDIPYYWNGVNPVAQSVLVGEDITGAPVYQQLSDIYAAASWMSYQIGPSMCSYSRYVDIFSESLIRYSKNTTVSTKGNRRNLMYRLFLNKFSGYDVDPGALNFTTWPVPANAIIWKKPENLFYSNVANPVTHNLNPSENITDIQFTFRDEYGNLFEGTDPFMLDVSGNQIPIDIATYGLYWNIGFYMEI